MRVSNVTVRKRLLFVLLFGVIMFLIIDTRLGYVQFVIGRKTDFFSERFLEPELAV